MSKEFGREFRDSLRVVAGTGRLSQEYRQVLQDGKHLIGNRRLRRFIYACSRVMLGWLSDFARVDLLADERRENRWRRKWWPHLMLAALLINAATLCELVHRQYLFDFSRFRHEQLTARLAEPGRTSSSRAVLRERLAEASREFQVANASAHLISPFVWQYTIMYYLPSALILNLFISSQFYRNGSILLALRAILDESKEASTWARLVAEELEHLARDSLAFMSSKNDQIGENLTLSGHKNKSRSEGGRQSADETEGRILMANSSRRLSARHQQLKARLSRIALEGRLNRLQRSPRSRDLLHLTFLVSFWVAIESFIAGVIFSHLQLKTVFAKAGKVAPPLVDSITLDALNLMFLFLTAIIAISFWAALLVTAVSDQLLYVRKMKLIMSHLIATNTHRVLKMIAIAERLEGQGHLLESRLRSLNEALETDLLVVILQWRLASRSFDLLRQSVTNIVLFGAYFTASMPILFRIHSPYLPAGTKQVNAAVGLFAMVLTWCCLWPLAKLHHYWTEVFRSLWSVVALLGRLESMPAIRERLMTGSSVAFLTLRREVSDPIQRNGRFAFNIVSMPTTYPNLIQILTWVILILSSIYDNQNNLLGSWLGHYMDDPFGLIDRDEP